MINILLFGKNGQLGWELQRCLPTLGTVVSVDQDEIDLVHSEQVRTFIREQKPQVIVNASAFTAVDRAEEEPEIAGAVNAQAPELMAKEAKRLGALLVHYSTDYVFDGTAKDPYQETDRTNPINVYGQTKLEGEQAIQACDDSYLIFRTSWVYSLRGGGFIQSILRQAEEQKKFRVVTDQSGSPTWARTLAEATTQILSKADSAYHDFGGRHRGVYHLAGEGTASRYDWAVNILEFASSIDSKYQAELLPAKSSEFPALATRPTFSALDIQRFKQTFNLDFPGWQDALSLALLDL